MKHRINYNLIIITLFSTLITSIGFAKNATIIHDNAFIFLDSNLEKKRSLVNETPSNSDKILLNNEINFEDDFYECPDQNEGILVFYHFGAKTPDEALGSPDGLVSTLENLNSNIDIIELFLEKPVPVNTPIDFHLTRESSNTTQNSTVELSYSTDGINYSVFTGTNNSGNITISPGNVGNVVIFSRTAPIPIEVKYVRIKLTSLYDIGVDAVTAQCSPLVCPASNPPTDPDTDGDGVPDSIDVDDDNDGISDDEERYTCAQPNQISPLEDALVWVNNGFNVFTIANNINGLGFRESGWEQEILKRGQPNIVSDPNLTFLNSTTDGNTINATFSGGDILVKANSINGVTNGLTVSSTNLDDFDSGTAGDPGINALQFFPNFEPNTEPTPHQYSYTISIRPTTPFNSFGFDLVDILDLYADPAKVISDLSVTVNNKPIWRLFNSSLGTSSIGNTAIFNGSDKYQGSIINGQELENFIGFVGDEIITSISINIKMNERDNRLTKSSAGSDIHGLDNFRYALIANCARSDMDGDGIPNHLDLDSDNDGIPDAIEGQVGVSTADMINCRLPVNPNSLNEAGCKTGETLITVENSPVDTDNDGLPNYLDLDSDGDLCSDAIEANSEADSDIVNTDLTQYTVSLDEKPINGLVVPCSNPDDNQWQDVSSVGCGNYDFGDLPSTYGNTITKNLKGIAGNDAVWAGGTIDFEFEAEGDNAFEDGDDEDGISEFPQMIIGNQSFDVDITLNSTNSNKPVYYGLWIDWENNGTFSDNTTPATGFYTGSIITSSPVTESITITTPSNYSGSPENLNYRLRASDEAIKANDFQGLIENGETEDYNVASVLLPVELISFTAEKRDEKVVLNWETATELNNEKFELEYSLDGIRFQRFAEVAGQGTTREATNYVYTHEEINQLGARQIFYRIRQVDFDGTASYSEIEVVVFAAVNQLIAYPVPAQKGEQIIVSGTNSLESFEVFDLKGVLVWSGESKTSEIISIPTSQIGAGSYIVVIKTGENIRIVIE